MLLTRPKAKLANLQKLILSLVIVAMATSCSLTGRKADSNAPDTAQAAHQGGPPPETLTDEFGEEKGAVAPSDKSAKSESPQKPMAKADPKAQAANYAALAKSNRFEQIRDEATRDLSAHGNSAAALNALALIYYKKNQLGAARIVLERALEKNPNSAQTLTNLAVLDLAEKEPAHALANLKKSYQIDDRNIETLSLLGSAYLQNHDYAKALGPLEQSYKNNKSNPQVANNYAIVLTKNKAYDQAQKVYDEILVQNSRDPAILLNYAGLLVDYLNKPKEALNLVYKVKFLENDKKDIVDMANRIEKKAKNAQSAQK